jgi:phosphatidylglycerol:prolipoprotein diacylglycerol transferase
VAFWIGPVAVRWYALAYLVGLFGGLFYAQWLVGRERLFGYGAVARPTRDDLSDMLLWSTLGVVLGGRLVYVIFYNPLYFLSRPLEIPMLWTGGMSFHGGLIGAAIAIWLYGRRHGLNPLTLFDIASTVAPIGLLLGRIANFINAELWGRVSDVPWAMVFPGAGPLPRHPSQLYEAAAEGLLLLVILAVVVNRVGYTRPGLIAGLFGAGYALARIGCEFFREPDRQLGFLFGGFATMGMLLSLPMLAIGLWLIQRARRI